MYFGAITKGDIVLVMLENLGDIFEQSAANGTAIRDIVREASTNIAVTT